MTFPLASGSQCAHLRLWNVILLLSEVPFASALTLETLAAHRAVRGLFKSRPSIFVGDLNGKDYPSRLARALVPVGMPILTHDRHHRNILVCRGGCRSLRCIRYVSRHREGPDDLARHRRGLCTRASWRLWSAGGGASPLCQAGRAGLVRGLPRSDGGGRRRGSGDERRRHSVLDQALILRGGRDHSAHPFRRSRHIVT
jgi:hypothetical protein